MIDLQRSDPHSLLQHVGSYQELRERTAKVENEVGWEGKTNKLFWRGSMKVGTADREALMGSAKGYDWNDVLGIDWGCEYDEGMEEVPRQASDHLCIPSRSTGVSSSCHGGPLQVEVSRIPRRQHLQWKATISAKLSSRHRDTSTSMASTLDSSVQRRLEQSRSEYCLRPSSDR
jgi:hypothetical protein